jgi:hypothetical protein
MRLVHSWYHIQQSSIKVLGEKRLILSDPVTTISDNRHFKYKAKLKPTKFIS